MMSAPRDGRDSGEQPQRVPVSKPVIDLDAEPENANWLRILAQHRHEQDKARGDTTDGQDDEDANG